MGALPRPKQPASSQANQAIQAVALEKSESC